MLEDQNLPDDRYNWIHTDDVGGYSYVDESMFWDTPAELEAFISQMQEIRAKKPVKSANRPASPRKRAYKNPIINGVVKRGRPRKDRNAEATGGQASGTSEPTKRRAQKRKAAEAEIIGGDVDQQDVTVVENETAVTGHLKPRKKRKKGEQSLGAPVSTTVILPSAADTTAVLSEAAGSAEMAMTTATAEKDAALNRTSIIDTSETQQESVVSLVTESSGSKKKKKRLTDDIGDSMSTPRKKRQRTAVTASSPVEEPAVLHDRASHCAFSLYLLFTVLTWASKSSNQSRRKPQWFSLSWR